MRTYLLLFFALCGAISLRAAQPLTLITRGTTNAAGATDSFAASMTPEGRQIVFASHANNLVTNDDLQPYGDIFTRDVASATTSLVTVNRSGLGGGDGNSGYASISGNGRYVVFSSDAGNLVANDTNGVSDVFRRDLLSGTTELVSVALSGGIPRASWTAPIAGASKPAITQDGRWIAFESASTELVHGDTNTTRKVFLRDMEQGITVLANGSAPHSSAPSLSTNASRLAFLSRTVASTPEGTKVYRDVIFRDLQSNAPVWASADVPAILQSSSEGYTCSLPVLAPDGSFVVFKARANSFLASTHVFHHDVTTRVTAMLATNSYPNTPPQISDDGRWLAFEENSNIYLRDLQNGTNLLISADVAGAAPAAGLSHTPIMTPDARWVAFLSSAPNLITNSPVSGTNQFFVYARDVASGVTFLVSRSMNGDPTEVAESTSPMISADGAAVVFDTTSAELVANDINSASDVFRHNRQGATTMLISARHPDRPSRTGVQSAGITKNSVSADGRRIAFASMDDPRIPGDTNQLLDVFVYDAASNTIIPQRVDPNADFSSTNRAFSPILSASGTHLLFAVGADAAHAVFGQEYFRLMWRAVDGGPTIEIPGNRQITGLPVQAALSSNGTVVVYVPAGNYLTVRDMVSRTNATIPREHLLGDFRGLSLDERWIIMVHTNALRAINLASNYVIILNRAANGTLLSVGRTSLFDESGRYCFFDSAPSFPFGPALYRYDFQTGSNQVVCTNCYLPSVDRSGNLLAVTSGSPYSSTQSRDIYLIDLVVGTTNLISANYSGTGAGNGESKSPIVSGDGRYVIFVSSASDLVLNDNNQAQDIVIHDRLQKSTALISRNYQGAGSGNALSSMPVLARDGRTVVFQSFANDIVEGDYNERRDIFVLRLGSGDSDNDGLDDDWEVAFFGDLRQTATGDRDSDGHSNLQEFQAGTDPTNTDSILRVLTLTSATGGGTTILWAAVPGRSYIVQFKDSLDATDWTNASGVITASSNTESFPHPAASAQRFYRVVAVQ